MLLRREPLALPFAGEVALLAALLRGEAVDADVGDRFVTAAAHHRLTGFALTAAAEGRLRLAAGQRKALATEFTVAALHSALLRRELPGILAPLAAASVQPVLLKGPAVAARYPDPALRTYVDVDLLVPRNRLAVAVDALGSAGYRPQLEFRPGFGERHGHDVHVVRRIGESRIDVELHWRIGDDPAGSPLDWERVRRGGHRLVVGEAEVAVAGPAEQLLLLALHLLSDRSKRLIWVEDLALAACTASDGEWERAFALADELRLAWPLHRALDYPAALLALDRPRPRPAGAPPPWGPLRAVETLDLTASTHVGRLAILGWSERTRYLRDVLVPTRAGLEGTVGGDGAPAWRLAARHVRSVIAGLAPGRR